MSTTEDDKIYKINAYKRVPEIPLPAPPQTIDLKFNWGPPPPK